MFCFEVLCNEKPDFERLMVPRKNGACEIIKTFFAFFTFITLTRGFVGKTPTDDPPGVAERAGASFGPAKFTNGIVTFQG